MTRLELAICEAENNGEIDICTRDMMLEATAIIKYRDRIQKEIDKYQGDIDRLKEVIKKSKIENSPGVHELLSKSTQAKIDKLEEKKDRAIIKRKMHTYDPAVMANSYGRVASQTHAISRKCPGNKSSRDHFNNLINDGIEWGMEKKKRYPQYTDEPKPGRYKTTNGLKESVLEEIYEAELNGDITPEERMSLIDYMDY